MTTRVEAGQRIRHVIDVDAWLLARNDDAPTPGRVVVFAGCAGCEQRARMLLWAGRWHVEHDHGRPWTAHLVRLTGPGDAPLPTVQTVTPAPTVDDVALLAAGLADAFTA